MSVESFTVNVPQSILHDLHERLASTRFVPGDIPDDYAEWDAGTSPAYLRQLIDYWQTTFDWRIQEANVNRFAQFRATIGDQAVHFIHERGAGAGALPLLLTHGYPDSFLRFLKVIPLLTDPLTYGGDPRDAFDVIVPSLPGFGFSDKPEEAGDTLHVGDLWHKLMTQELGYKKFGAHGGDWGSIVTEQMAHSHASDLIGIHLSDVPFWHALQPKISDLSPAEEKYLASIQQFQQQEGAYAMMQGTRPQTLADCLNDSPAGLAAWLIEKFQRMSDCRGIVETRFTKDELLTNITLYWATQTIGSSFMSYYDQCHASAITWLVEKAKAWIAPKVPAGFARFPRELTHPPKEWAQRFFDVRRWTEMPRGGHFGAMEEPALLAEDIRAFFRPLRAAN
jgi:microsomal epoxide hydrolase